MSDLIAAWLATATRPPREWPAADTPDYEPRDDGDDDWPDAQCWELPIGWPR